MIIVSLLSLCLDMWSMASCTSFSDLGSKALVASSRISILGLLMMALAMAILYF